MTFGYRHPEYAQSLSEFGTPTLLSRCGGWILKRPIPGRAAYDAIGCYPLFCCEEWSQLHADLEELKDTLVSLALVTDPFGTYDQEYLRRHFDILKPFKTHYVIDLQQPLHQIASSGRRKSARRALRNLQIDVSHSPHQFLNQWQSLFNNLIERHHITGMRAYSTHAFDKQLQIPGAIMLRAIQGDQTVGASLYLKQGDVIHCHLAAASPNGYRLGAFSAMDWFSFKYFSDTARWLNLGGGAGIHNNGTDGLSEYKRSWHTTTKETLFCGKILNPEKYVEIVQSKKMEPTNYFPAYRVGEFE